MKKDSNKIDVSVIVATYNSSLEGIKATTMSIIEQVGITFEIIFADDGSESSYQNEITDFCKHYNFQDYRFEKLQTNQGTVLNIHNALRFARGEYTKTIAPGDLLFCSTTLHDWIEFMNEHKLCVSFGDAVYYNFNQGRVSLVSAAGSPANKEYYGFTSNTKCLFIDYLVANDTVLGAAQLMRTETIKKYINVILTKVKYAEDYMIRIMIFDGILLAYFPQNVIWYEYGDGISTSASDKWKKALYEDYIATEKIISNLESSACWQKKYQFLAHYRGIKRKILKVVCFPGVITCRIKMKRKHKEQVNDYDTQPFYQKILTRRYENAGD